MNMHVVMPISIPIYEISHFPLFFVGFGWFGGLLDVWCSTLLHYEKTIKIKNIKLKLGSQERAKKNFGYVYSFIHTNNNDNNEI